MQYVPADPVLRSTRKLTAPPDVSAQVSVTSLPAIGVAVRLVGWCWNRVGVAPAQDILHGGQSAGGAGESGERRGAAHSPAISTAYDCVAETFVVVSVMVTFRVAPS